MAEYRNGYVFYVNSKHVIDAWTRKKALARYANDAMGIVRVEGVKNNSEYIVHKKRCYITAEKNIPAGSEILVAYGAEYWQVIRYNVRLEQKNREKEGKDGSKVQLPHHQLSKKELKSKRRKPKS